MPMLRHLPPRSGTIAMTFAGLLATAGSAAAAAPKDAGGAQRVHALPIQYRAHLPLIQVEINGKGPFDVIVDTGADITVIDQALAAELELPVLGQREIGSPMAETHLSHDEVQMRSLCIGDALIEDVVGVTMDLQSIFGKIEAPHAVLSAASFKGWLMTLDFPGERVLMKQGELPAADGKTILDYTAEAYVPHIAVTVGDIELVAAMDTGAPSMLSLPGDYMNKLTLQSEPKVVGMGRTVDASFEILAAPLDGKLMVGAESFVSPSITFNERSPKPVLGMRALGEFRITLDCSNRRVQFIPNRAASDSSPGVRRMVRSPSNKKSYGIMFSGLSGDALEVTGVEDGLIAAAVGLQRGDRIVAMNGILLTSLDEEERIACLRGSPLLLQVERSGEMHEIAMSRD